MKNVLLYGQQEKFSPWIKGYRSNPDGSLNFELSGVNVFEIKDPTKGIEWSDLFNSEKSKILSQQELDEMLFSPYPPDGDPYGYFYRYINRLWDRLLGYCNPKSRAEKNFFEMYLQLCWNDNSGGAPADSPALIPNVFVNWQFDKSDRQNRVEPYIVDFVFKHRSFGSDNLTVVEIDGLSHYANFLSGKYEISEEKYAKHLAKDRWLRRNGFNVVRIANYEIEGIMKLEEEKRLREFFFFFTDIFGPVIAIDRFSFP
jgi:very-short-patch-repair endonuclease